MYANACGIQSIREPEGWVYTAFLYLGGSVVLACTCTCTAGTRSHGTPVHGT